ncbi:hypothetical protein MF406_14205 [Georgenia sp. TF02-10]|uniref:hypothetical protein n=1 Tax=Georgenia sp. TF02-10 TaxID=2917725 RepID=UPI001FA72B17|nr:hypothetical protein [Georgenia sp. TF02-10]UNX54085.1 hypothetical protein MF406_14205 [Georgenia sp. TF02-10]
MGPFAFRSTDRIRVPEGTWLAAGDWAVDGEPHTWPVDVVDELPTEWLCTVTVLRPGPPDRYGYPGPDVEIEVDGCLLASRSTSDPVDRTDLTSSTGVLMRRGGAEVPLRKG